jgi:hypothetical protein
MTKPINNEKAVAAREKMKAVLSRLSKTEDGAFFLNYLYRISGFAQPATVVSSTGKVDMEATFHNNARRDAYLSVRTLMIPEVIKAVELDYKIEEEVPKDADRT